MKSLDDFEKIINSELTSKITSSKIKHNHIYLTLNNAFILVYNDVRRFGFFKIYNNTDLKKITFLKKLGLEPLSHLFNTNYFKNYVKNKKKY